MTPHRQKLVGLLAATATVAGGLALATTPPAAAAPTDVVINEMMFHAISDLDGDDYLELFNRGTTAVDLSGWTFSGITLTLATGTTINPGGFLVVAKDAVQFQATYGFAPAAVYGGNLSNSGETVALKDNTAATIDTVSFLDVDPWPVKADGTGPSLELIDATLDNNDFLNWAAATNAAGFTPGAPNSVRRVGLGPRVTNVAINPTAPTANQPVTVTATITDQTSAVLRYRIDFNAEQTLPMTAAGADSYTATIPGAGAGHLIRYRVSATNANATTLVPRVDDTIVYRGVVVPHGITSPIPVLEWFIADSDYNFMVANPLDEIVRMGAIAYNGQVIDNVEVNIKGHASRQNPKVSWKFHTPQGYDLVMPGLLVDPVDEFDMQADWADKAHGRAILSWEAYQRAGIVNHQMFPIRTQRNGAFQGEYSLQDTYDGTWREREGYDDKQFFEAETSAFSTRPVNVQFSKKAPDETDFAPIAAFVNGVRLSGNAQRDYLLANADLPQLINYAAVTAITEHHDSSSKNFFMSQDPVTGRWSIIPWDLDHTLGSGCCQVDSNFVTPAEPGDNTSALMRGLLAVPAWRDMYFRRLRTLVNDILAPGRMEALYDARVGPAQSTAALDFAAWPYPNNPNFAQQRTRLFSDIQSRRTVFNSDARVPGNQPAAPDIVIDEIQHSPGSGDTAEFLELYNPGSQAIDLSGWTISGGITLAVQPGTVILPHAAMTFVSNDPAFRAAYSSTVFVGGRYTGSLAPSATLTLTRPDGSVADDVTYGGAGWPVPTSGQSLELQDLAADNNVGANWALSTGSGTPGAVGAPAITAPGAPTIGTATLGNGSATVRWTAPADNGGSAVTGYSVKVLNAAEQQVGALRPAGAGATSLVVTGLTNGTAYHFQVAAINSAGTGAFSASSNAVTPSSGVTVPGPPTIGTATAGSSSATVRWTAPANNGGSAVTGYSVMVLDSAEQQVGALRPSGAGTTSLVVTGLTSGSAYHFQVAAINSAGTGAFSASSNTVTPTAGATVPGPPVIGAPTQGATGGALTAVAHWTPPTSTGGSAITGYVVTALRMSSAAADATVLSRTDSRVLGPGVRQREFTLVAGNYRFEVVAINAVGTGAPSARSANVVPR